MPVVPEREGGGDQREEMLLEQLQPRTYSVIACGVAYVSGV